MAAAGEMKRSLPHFAGAKAWMAAFAAMTGWRGCGGPNGTRRKSFLLLFFRKEGLAYLLSLAASEAAWAVRLSDLARAMAAGVIWVTDSVVTAMKLVRFRKSKTERPEA